MSRYFRCALLFLVVLAFTPTVVPASAQVYDAANDFSTASNPNDVWSYGWSQALGSTFILDTGLSIGSQIDQWYNTSILTGNGYFPYISHNKTNTEVSNGTQRWHPNQMLVHPGPYGEYSVLRWTAPIAGTWLVDAVFDGQDIYGTTTDCHVLLNSTSLFDGNVNGYLASSSFTQAIVVAPGDTIDFAVGYGANDNYHNDSTGVAVTIQPTIEPSTLVLTPAILTGGASGMGTVMLTFAPATDTTVTLASSDPTAASVPNSITIPAGATSGTFPITSYSVVPYTPVTITAAANGVPKSATLIVTPSGNPTFVLTPNIVVGGVANSTGTITVPGPAPAGGIVIALSSNNPSVASVPSSVTIPAGATSVTFSVTTYPVSVLTFVGITASSNGMTGTAGMEVLP